MRGLVFGKNAFTDGRNSRKTENDLKWSVFPRFLLECTLLKLVYLDSTVEVEQLLEKFSEGQGTAPIKKKNDVTPAPAPVDTMPPALWSRTFLPSPIPARRKGRSRRGGRLNGGRFFWKPFSASGRCWDITCGWRRSRPFPKAPLTYGFPARATPNTPN